MNKPDFVKAITEHINKDYEKTFRGKEVQFSQNDTRAYLNAIRDVVYECAAEDEVPLIEGLTVTTKIQPASVRRNPGTGESVNVPEKRVPKIKIGKSLKNALAYAN